MGIFDKHFADADDDLDVQVARELIDLTIALHETKTANQAIQEENARLVEALEIYADEKNWMYRESCTKYTFKPGIGHGGFGIAKAALADTRFLITKEGESP